jgi:hypothetical protein
VKLACAGLFSLPLNVLSCAKDILFLTSFGVESCRACQIISVSSAGVQNLQKDGNGPVDEPKFLNQGKVSSISLLAQRGQLQTVSTAILT